MKRLNLGMHATSCRTTSMTHQCAVCGESMGPQMVRAHFETFKTNAYTSFKVRHRSHIAWRVCAWSHLSCSTKEAA